MNVGIIGSGIVGLTTALELQKEFPDVRVTLIADKFFDETTSYVAAGIFRPSPSFIGLTEELTSKWIYDAFNYWENIRKSREALAAGVCQLSAYIFSSSSSHIVRNHYIEKIVPIYRRATEEELLLCPGDWKYGSFFTTNLIECKYFMPWATEIFKNAGGKIIKQKVEKFVELYGKYDMLINCSGLGSKNLCNDHKLVSIRGQIIKVQAPFVKTAFYGDLDTYIIPGRESVTLGGCRQYESYDMNISKYDRDAITERCHKMLPSLVGAPVVKELVGLRPHRDPLRVEPEVINTSRGNIRIIHNYGHGGYGVTTSPGTAKYAIQLLKDMHKRTSFKQGKL